MKIKKEVIICIFICIFFLSNIFLIKSQEVSTLATVEVKPAYDLVIDIEIPDDKISSEETLSVFVNLEKTDLTGLSEEIGISTISVFSSVISTVFKNPLSTISLFFPFLVIS